MENTKGLKEFVTSKNYRKSLNLGENVIEEYEMIGQGEYNRNYLFTHPNTGKKMVLRVNFGSQMHLDNQIEYEYMALKELEKSNRTPKVYYVDSSKKDIEYGILVMEYLEGHHMDYDKEIFRACDILADIHSTGREKKDFLIEAMNPLKDILDECEQMFSVYSSSDLKDEKKESLIRKMLDSGWKRVNELSEPSYKCIINTELNSTNFLIGEGDYLVDWEKPIYGEPAQDIAHFLAPTTTFWKTDVILDRESCVRFVEKYIESVNGRFDTEGLLERVEVFIPITCLRGITWCSMAWVEYNDPDREIVNVSTFEKLKQYLDYDFLENIYKDYLI